jgi:hypothetical protein
MVIVDSDLRQAIGCQLQLSIETLPRIFAVLRREDHLILT